VEKKASAARKACTITGGAGMRFGKKNAKKGGGGSELFYDITREPARKQPGNHSLIEGVKEKVINI